MIIETVFHSLVEFLRFIWFKALLALIPAGVFIITDMHREVLAIVLWILIIDTILGAMVAIKKKRFCSYKLIKAIYKFIIYMFAIATAYLVSLLELPLLNHFYFYVGSFIIVTEAISNFENLAELGFKFPISLLKKINRDMQELDKEAMKKYFKNKS